MLRSVHFSGVPYRNKCAGESGCRHRQGREEAREELRREIVDLVCARLPGLREELAARLRELPEARLARIAVELGPAHDEDAVRAALDRVLGRVIDRSS